MHRNTFWRPGRNLLVNSAFAGAASGVPGTVGRGHANYYPDGANGITVLINAVGIETGPRGVYEYIEWRVFGTPTVNGGSYYFPATQGSFGANAAGPFDGWPPGSPFGVTFSMEMRLFAGSLPTNVGIGWNEQSSASGFLNNPKTYATPGSTYQVVSQSLVPDFRTEWCEPFFFMFYTAGVQMDCVLHVARPQFEVGLQRTPYERKLTI